MITRPLQRVGDHFVVTIPEDEIERRGLQEGQIVGIQFTPDDDGRKMSPELRRIMDEFWAEHGEDFDAMFKDEWGR